MKNLHKSSIDELFEMMGLLKKMIKAPDMLKDKISFIKSQISEIEQELVMRPTPELISYADKIIGVGSDNQYLSGCWPLKKNPF